MTHGTLPRAGLLCNSIDSMLVLLSCSWRPTEKPWTLLFIIYLIDQCAHSSSFFVNVQSSSYASWFISSIMTTHDCLSWRGCGHSQCSPWTACPIPSSAPLDHLWVPHPSRGLSPSCSLSHGGLQFHTPAVLPRLH